jgi:hypothetical protein
LFLWRDLLRRFDAFDARCGAAFVRVGLLQVSGGGERKCAKASDDQHSEQRHLQHAFAVDTLL